MSINAIRSLRLISLGLDDESILRVAVATAGSGFVDETFGRTTMFAIYEVATDTSRLAEVIQFDPLPRKCDTANDNPDDCEQRVAARMSALATCQLVFARRIGDVAAALAMKNRIHPITLTRDEAIPDLLTRCRAMLANNPPRWLRRATGADIEAGVTAHTEDEPDGTESAAIVRDGTSLPAQGGVR